MKIQEQINMQGWLSIQVHNTAGELCKQFTTKNSIVLAGRDLVAKMFIHETIDPVSHIAVGTGTTPVDPAVDSALVTELFRKTINPIDPSIHLTTTAEDKKKVMVTVDLDFTEGNGALTEAGMFNADAAGVMYNRVVFPAINKTTDFRLTLIWEIIF